MGDDDMFRQSIAASEHVRTIAALMHKDGVDIIFATCETPGGIPYVAVVVQGAHAQTAEDWAGALARYIERARREARNEAERG